MTSLNMFKVVALLVVLFASWHQSSGQSRKCGAALDSVLETICESGFNTKFKKSMEWDNLGHIELGDNLPSRFSPFPFLGSIHGGQVDTLAKTRRRRQGIYDECCRKPCSYNELYSYCQ